jgi:hypothetical protein
MELEELKDLDDVEQNYQCEEDDIEEKPTKQLFTKTVRW